MEKVKGSKDKPVTIKITPGGQRRVIYNFETQAWTIETPSTAQEAFDADIAAAMEDIQRREAGQV